MIDPKEFRRGLHEELQKNAGFWDDMGAARAGASLATKNINPLLNPIDYIGGLYEGAKKGYAGKVMNEQTAGLQNDGVAFQRDEYGRLIGVNKGDTIKNYASNMFNGLPEGLRNGMSSIGDFVGRNKTPLLWGAGLLGGGYLLKKMLFDNDNEKRQGGGVTNIYLGANPGMRPAPQAFEKMSSFNMPMPPSFQLPSRFANAVTGEMTQEEQAPPAYTPPQTSYQPMLSSDDPKLQKLLKDPRMRDYLTNLIKQVNTPNSFGTEE